jgi:SPP1 family predicted phage head-tail adaptor
MLSQRLRFRVDIQRPTQVRDPEDGSFSTSWVSILTPDELDDVGDPALPAEIVALSGRELLAAAAEQADITTRIVIRYRTDVRADMRLVHDGLRYNIRAVIPDPKRAMWLTLMCTSGVNDG